MLYEMLTGRVAFPAPTEYARLAAVLNTTPPPLESVDPSLARLSAFVQLAMQKDRAQRFQTGLEMARALSAALGAEGAPPAGPLPLSRLPEVPSVFAPIASPAATSGPAGQAPQTAAAPSFTSQPPPEPVVGPGGTLASAAGRSVTEPPPQVQIVGGPAHGTLPSENLPMLSAHGARRGVAPWLVFVLVVGALVAGFLLGYAFAITRVH